MAMNPFSFSGAAADLGLGDLLASQVDTETEEMRKKRMAQIQQMQMGGPDQSLAVKSLFGPMGMGRAGY